MKAIYKITVVNWDQHNPNAKKSYKKIMINTRFFEDAKIQMLPPGARLVFIGLVLACGDLGQSTVECSHEALLRFIGGTGHHIQRLLDQLQEFQLVKYEFSHIKRIEGKIKEKKVREEKAASLQRSPDLPAEPTDRILEIWNLNSGKLPKAKGLNPTRKKQCAVKWREKPDENYWVEVVKRMSESNFCNGKNDRGWLATFDFFLKGDTHLKVLEGKYDNRTTAQSTNQTRKYDKLDELERQWSEKEVT